MGDMDPKFAKYRKKFAEKKYAFCQDEDGTYRLYDEQGVQAAPPSRKLDYFEEYLRPII